MISSITYENSLEFAQKMDTSDPLRQFRNYFHIPLIHDKEAIYLCGNSLGLQPKAARNMIEQEMLHWQTLAVEGHFLGKQPWLTYHKQFRPLLSNLTGALSHEVVAMNNLTTNLHLMMISFYQPTSDRYRIIMEAGAFPSDQYAVESQVRFHGFDPSDVIIEIKPREGEHTLRTEDIIQAITNPENKPALVLFGGVNYYTGQVFDMQAISKTAHEAGAYVGFDLAHAIGNVSLHLHDWGADFAVWCSYKYLNSSPGGISGAFVHERHANNPELPRLAGWWGYDEATRFQMKKGFIPQHGADGWQLANAPILLMAVHRASLDIFQEAGLENLRQKSILLTGYLEFLIQNDPILNQTLHIITPSNPEERGCQLSMLTTKNGKGIFDKITEAGVIGDWREPNVIRLSPVPLYNSFEDIYRCGEILSRCVREITTI
ncbi:kynureninase [Cytophagaceae bacterium YF14B1]|uniref:Kynureninase n=1 Tax=Xanthocytophaga flava TaxID=3048013 RepID=A0AAE3U8Z8_9BACT|nr:kynureninase [Xanthocytophaga flavus]MDJ1483167.1 kynureninase [Xanthocytophaga flavus]